MPRWRQGIALTAVLALAGALSATAAQRHQAPPPPPPSKGPIEYLEGLLPWTQVGPAPDFVRDSRPAEQGPFIPTGSDAPEQALRVKTPAELAAATAEFEKARTEHENLRAHPPGLTAAAAPPPAPPPPPAAPAKPSAKKKRVAKRKPPVTATDN